MILLFRPTGLLGESLGKGTGMSVFTTAMDRVRDLPKPARIALWAVFVVFLFVLPLLNIPVITTPDSDFGGVLFTVSTYVLVALGLNIVVGYAGLLDLGYVGFYAIGAYTVGVLGSAHAKIPWLLCVPIAVVAALISGLILGAPTLRVRGDYLAIVTLGFGEIVRLTLVNRLARRGGRHHRGAPAARACRCSTYRGSTGQPGRRWSTWTTRPRS